MTKQQNDKAQPKPGDAQYDWQAAYGADVPIYRHTFPDGTTVALKTFQSIYNKTWMYKLRRAKTDIELIVSALDRGSNDAANQVLDNLDDEAGDPIADLYSAWILAGTSNGDGDEGLTPGN